MEKELNEERDTINTKEEMLYSIADNMLSEFQDFHNASGYRSTKIKKVNMKNGMIKNDVSING